MAGVGVGHAEQVGRIELQYVRDQLDWLNFLRLDGPLSPTDEAVYEGLCKKERQLLQEVEWASL